MTQILVRHLDPKTITRLKHRAKLHRRSLQGEVKCILEEVASLPNDKSFGINEENKTHTWPPNFLNQILGGWQGETLTRPSQGDYEERDELE